MNNTTKLVLISVNGRSAFVRLSADADGKFRVSSDQLYRLFGIRRGDCICVG